MSQKQNKKNKQNSRPAPAPGGGGLSPEQTERVLKLIEGRHSKAALQLAKDLFKRSASPESEALLVRAYKARIDDLLKLGLCAEAKALLGIVRDRFPAAAARLEEHDREISAIEGKLEEVVGPLSDANLPAQDRDRIETFIRKKVYDLPALAAVSSLPPEHPLRSAATALASAFQAVTQGPVDDALLALPQVSHRSPLAPWKALVRAIASYHRREDAECRKWLQAIAKESVPARLVPCLTAMMGTKNSAKLTPAEQKLIVEAGDHAAALHSAVEALDAAFKTRKQARIVEATRTAVAASQCMDREARDRLRQHIAVRAAMQHIHSSAIHAALGGLPPWDAYYFRLMARSMEEQRVAESAAQAVTVWEDFRRQAIKEKWFAAGGLEDGVLALHVAQLMQRIPPDIIDEMREEESFSRGRSKAGEEVLPSPEVLYERSCKADPSFEGFQSWLAWARKGGTFHRAEHVAETWRKARPKDIQPLLYLMESTEKRSAYQKSLKYLEEAEELDRLNPEVRRAKLRLLLGAAIRHLQQRKTHLAEGGIEQIESVPEVRPGEVIALAAALRWCCAAIDSDPADRMYQEKKLHQSMGEVAAYLLLAALATAGKMDVKAMPPLLQVSRTPAAELLTGAVKACVLGQWAGLSILLPRSWNDPLIAAQKLPHSPLDAAQLLALGEAAFDSGSAGLAYAVATTGLAGGRAHARFLFLRARCLPRWASLRQEACSRAALELARRERETELAGKILDRLSRGQRGLTLPPELLSQILEEEQESKEIPVYEGYRDPKYAAQLRSLQQEDSGPWDDEDDFEDEDDFDQPPPGFMKKFMKKFEEILGQLPRELAQKVERDIARGEDPITAMDKVMGKVMGSALPQPPASFQKGKAAKDPLPVQGSLF